MTKVSKNIKELRKERNMTQDELAQKLFVTRQAVSSWENDRTQPDIFMLGKIREVFGVSIEELLYGKEDIYMDTSSTSRKLASEEIRRIIRKHDTQKILFGTDYPIERHDEALANFERLGLTDEETENILYNNAHRLLCE